MLYDDIWNVTGPHSLTQEKRLRAWSVFVIMVTAMIGHSLVFLAICRERRLRTIPNFIILNLSIADFFFTAIVPTTHLIRLMRRQPSLTDELCYITGVATMLFCLASIYTLSFISIERFMATNYPMKHRCLFDKKLVKIVLVSIWCWSMLLSGFPFLTSKYVYLVNFFHCSPDWANDLGTTSMFIALGIVLPLTILVYCNVRIMIAIRKSGRPIAPCTGSTSDILSRNFTHLQHLREKQMSIVTIAVVAMFSVCWTPYCAAMVCLVSKKCHFPESFMVLALMLSTLNSCCNPIIYGLLNQNFRRALKNVLCCK